MEIPSMSPSFIFCMSLLPPSFLFLFSIAVAKSHMLNYPLNSNQEENNYEVKIILC